MPTPSPLTDDTSRSSQLKYHHNDSPPYIVHFRHITDTSAERINSLNVSRVIHKVFKHEILEVKSHGRLVVAASFTKVDAANAIINHSVLKENNLTASIPAFRIMRTGLIKNVPDDISDDEIIESFESPCKIISAK